MGLLQTGMRRQPECSSNSRKEFHPALNQTLAATTKDGPCCAKVALGLGMSLFSNDNFQTAPLRQGRHPAASDAPELMAGFRKPLDG
ncbi:MAG: hypothetical protein K2Y71_25370 [Xanthobacteraceae bacterium]|nr:hypothetical protein [Xanthobacteraceae bacterium]